MVLLDRIDEIDDETITASLTVRSDGLFNRDRRVPAWVGIEYMAQAVAAFAGYHALKNNQPVKLGFLLGTRHYQCNVEAFQVGCKLVTSARKLLRDDNGLAVFACRIDGPGFVVSANLNVFQPDNVEQYLQEK